MGTQDKNLIKGLAHLCFSVRNLETALVFYCEKLGLKIAFDFINDKGKRFGVYLHVSGRSFIEIFIGEPEPRSHLQSYGHMCLEVDDLNATVATLRERGVEVSDPKLGSDGSWQAWLSDPDGNRIELMCYTPQSKQTLALARAAADVA